MRKLLFAMSLIVLLVGSAQAVTYLRQSTAVTIKFQMVDVTDGHTPETGLTIDDADVLLMKAWGSWAAKSDTTDPAHVASGWHSCVLGTTDTGTVGPLYLRIDNQPTARLMDPNYLEFMVLAADWYDLQTGAASFMTTSDTAKTFRMELEKAVDNDPNAGSIAKLAKDGLTGHTPQTGDAYIPALAAQTAAEAMRLQTGTVATAGTASRFTLSSGFPTVAGAYPRGTVLTAVRDGQAYLSFIQTYTAGRVVRIEPPLPVAPELGDVVTIWPSIWTPPLF